MEIAELKQKLDAKGDAKLAKAYVQIECLLDELRKRNLPDNVVTFINHHIEDLNSIENVTNNLKKQIEKKQNQILAFVRKELKIVQNNYYCGIWMMFGMATIGLPLGVALGVSLDNLGLMAIGLPIGMVIGMLIGISMDRKALKEGRVLNL